MLAEVSDIAMVTRHLEVSRPSLSPWNDQFGGMQVDDAEGWHVVGVIEDRAKGVVAELVLDVEVPKEGPRGAFEATGSTGSRDALGPLLGHGASGCRDGPPPPAPLGAARSPSPNRAPAERRLRLPTG
jgi:hypothetical protein